MKTQTFIIISKGRELDAEVVKDSLEHSIGKHNIKVVSVDEVRYEDSMTLTDILIKLQEDTISDMENMEMRTPMGVVGLSRRRIQKAISDIQRKLQTNCQASPFTKWRRSE